MLVLVFLIQYEIALLWNKNKEGIDPTLKTVGKVG